MNLGGPSGAPFPFSGVYRFSVLPIAAAGIGFRSLPAVPDFPI